MLENITPEMATVAATIVIVIAGVAYAAITGRRTEINTDDDPEPEIVLGGEGDDGSNLCVCGGSGSNYDSGTSDYSGLGGGGNENLEAIDGVGPSTADALRAAGYGTVESIARVRPSALEVVEGIGEVKAANIQRSAERVADTDDE